MSYNNQSIHKMQKTIIYTDVCMCISWLNYKIKGQLLFLLESTVQIDLSLKIYIFSFVMEIKLLALTFCHDKKLVEHITIENIIIYSKECVTFASNLFYTLISVHIE